MTSCSFLVLNQASKSQPEKPGSNCYSSMGGERTCLHTGTFCVNVCIVFVQSFKYSMYNRLTTLISTYLAVASLTCHPTPLLHLLLGMCLRCGTRDCTLSAPSKVWIWGTEPFVKVQCYIVFIFGLKHMNVKQRKK